MNEFDDLLNTVNILLGPNGCEWDRKQTLDSLKLFFLEESYELIDAIDEKNNDHILEEAGDILFLVVFLSKIAENSNLFELDEVIRNIREKLVRRHPHVFGDEQVKGVDDILENWQKIKKEEKNHKNRKNIFDGLPRSMPVLMKAQKMISILKKKNYIQSKEKFLNKQQFDDQISSLLIKATNSGYDLETEIRSQMKSFIESAGIKNTGDSLEA